MASNEAQFRVEIVKSARAMGYHAFSINDQFLIGHPDVYIAREGVHCFLELKFIKSRLFKAHKIKLTAPQRAFMKAEQEAKCCAGWVLGVKSNDTWSVYAGGNVGIDSVLPSHHVQTIGRGVKLLWNVVNIHRRVMEDQKW